MMGLAYMFLNRQAVGFRRQGEHERISFPGWIRIFKIDAGEFVALYEIGKRQIVHRIGRRAVGTVGSEECRFRRQHSDDSGRDPLADHAAHKFVGGRTGDVGRRLGAGRLVVR